MIRSLTYFIIAIMMVGCPNGHKAAFTGPITIGEFEQQMEDLRERLHIPGMSAAIALDGEVNWSAGFGFADLELNIPTDTASIFQLASLTKPYTATVVLQLVDEGHIDLTTDISRYGMESSNNDTIRVWHVLSHTSAHPQGQRYSYDAATFGELGTLIDNVTDNSFAVELTDRVIRPLELNHTAPNPYDERNALSESGINPKLIEKNLVTGYARSWGQRVWPTGLLGPMKPMEHPTSFHTSAGLVASAPDVARFSIAWMEGQLLSDSIQTLALSPIVSTEGEIQPHGLGWFVQQYEGLSLAWYYGHWYGSSSLIVMVPELRLSFVVLANSDGLSRWRSLGDHGDILRSPAAQIFLKAFVKNRLTE